MKKSPNQLGSSGFTLVEMMVSVAVATILMLILVKFVQTATSAIVAGEDTLYSTNDAQTAMDLISQDLQSVRIVPTPLNSSAINGNAALGPLEVMEIYGNGGATDTSAGVQLSATANVKPQDADIYPAELYIYATPAAASFSNLSASDNGVPHLVRYMVAWQDPTNTTGVPPGNFPVLGLYRSVSSGSDTNKTVTAALIGEGTTATALRTVFNNQTTNGTTYIPTGPNINDLIVSNVIDFQVLIVDPTVTRQAGAPVTPLNNPTSPNLYEYYWAAATTQMSLTSHLSSQGLFIPANPLYPTSPVPYNQLYAEVKLVTLSQQGATLYEAGAFPLNDANSAKSNPVDKYIHVYTRRVPIIN
jgi:prepilin-type N-terminal cleavage/methylation domain-containing protein